MSTEEKGLDMVAIQEYEAMIVDGRKITEELCLEIIEMGEGLKGYGLFLAKEQVHAESKTGWDKFLKKADIVKSTANRAIDFYKAKSEPMGVKLPNKERTFRALTGETTQDKANQYAKVKELLHKEEPTASDIITFKKLSHEMKKSPQEKIDKAIVGVAGASVEVREAILKRVGVKGIKAPIDDLLDGKTDSEIMANLDGQREAVKATPKEKKTANKSLTDKIAKLEKENKELKARNKELEELEEYHKRIGTFKLFYLGLSDTLRMLNNIKAMSERAIDDMSPQIKQAYEILGVEINIADDSLKMVKKAYRLKAKELHPDMGGDADYFIQVKEAYEDLKEFLEEIGVKA